MKNNNNQNIKSFAEELSNLDDVYEQRKTLKKLLEENFEILEKQIAKHKAIKTLNKKEKEDLGIEDSFYKNLAKVLKNSKEFYGKDINENTLSSLMNRIRKEKKGK